MNALYRASIRRFFAVGVLALVTLFCSSLLPVAPGVEGRGLAFAEPAAAPKAPAIKPVSGYFYGNIVSIEPDGSALTILAKNGGGKRVDFSLDSKTVYWVNNRRAKLSDLYWGDRVIVNYLREGIYVLATQVIVVFEDVNLPEYIAKMKARKKWLEAAKRDAAEKASAGGESAKEGGGEKKAGKPKGEE